MTFGGFVREFNGVLRTAVQHCAAGLAAGLAGIGRVGLALSLAMLVGLAFPASALSQVTVTSVTPNLGPTAGGTQVTITGTNFSGMQGVTFGAERASYSVQSDTQITATAPANAPGTYDITVKTPVGTSAITGAAQFTYVAAPTVTSVAPNSGPTAGGTQVIITGTNFSAAQAVSFGGTSATGYTVNSATQITATAPAGSGTVDIQVTTPGGTSATSAADRFTYVAVPTVTSVSQSSGPTIGGTQVTITGTNFSAVQAVSFGSTPAAYTVDSVSQITAIAPAGSGTVDIRVTTSGGTSATTGADQFTYVAAPTVTSVAPNSGPTAGGPTVTITGTNFTAAQAVTFGGTSATAYTVISATKITATAPAGSGTVDIQVTTQGGTSAISAADQFTYVAAPTVTSVAPSSGPTAGGTWVTIIGTNFSGATVVTFGGATTGYTVNSATKITAKAPAGTGTVDIRVTTIGGTSIASPADQFTYADAPTGVDSSMAVAFGSSDNPAPLNWSGDAVTSVAVTTQANNGTATVDGTSIFYTPAPGYYGPDSFGYTGTGLGGTSAPVTMTVTVGLPPAPVIATATLDVDYETAKAIDLSTLITGVHTRIAVATAPSHGTVSVSGDVITYTPTAGYFGPDSLTYTATGPGGTSAPATVTVTVATPAPPTVAAVAVAAAYDAPTTIDLSTSITGVHTSIAVATAPSHGTASVSGDMITYTPTAGYFGPDSFTYTATGPGGTSAPATVTLTVSTPAPPTAAAVAVAAAYDAATTIDLSASITGVHTSIAVATAPSHGTVSVSGDVITYRPTTGYFGPDSLSYTATGPGGTSAPATVTLTVATPPVPAIDQPTGPVVVPPSAGGSISIDLGAVSQGVVEGYRITTLSQFGTAEIVDGAVVARGQSAGSVGTKAAQFYRLVYTPVSNFMGEDAVTVVAYGPGGESAPVDFTFHVVGKAPDLSGEVLAGSSTTFTPTAGLVGGPFQALRVTTPPSFGAVTVNGLSLVFTPGINGGTTTFDYVVDLPFGPSAAGRVLLIANAMPGSEALVAETLQGVPVTVRLGDVAGGPFTGAAVVSMAPVAAGEVTINKVGADYDLTFVSTGDFSGEAVVTYSLSNAYGTTNSTLTVTVEARPDPSRDPEVRGVATSQVIAARRFADVQINNFQQRLRDLHDGTNGSSNGLSLNLGLGGAEADRDPQQALRRQLGQDRGLAPGALGEDRDREMLGMDVWAGQSQASSAAGASDDRLKAVPQSATGAGHSVGLWTAGSVDWGRQDATAQRDSRFTTQGVTVGLDVKVSDQLIIGGGVGYGEDKTRIGDKGSVTNGKAFTGAFYASWRPAEAFYIDGVIGFANLDFTSRRWVEGLAGQADGYADGERSGDVRFASAAFGRILRSGRMTGDFYARLDARNITLDGFIETGGGLSALDWDEIEQKSLSANFGASWRWMLDSRRYGQFRPTARLEWSHELEDIGAQGVRYADWVTSPTYLVTLNAWSRNAINLDLGAEWSLSERLMLSLGYRGTLGDASTSHGAQIGMKYGW